MSEDAESQKTMTPHELKKYRRNQEILRLHEAGELSSYQIAATIGCSQTWVCMVIKAHGDRSLKMIGKLAFSHPSYPGYLVYPDGSVFSSHLVHGRFLKQVKSGKYKSLVLKMADGELRHRWVHRLVLEFLTGSIPDGLQSCHNNGNPSDNRMVNLRWGTPKENAADKVRHGTDCAGEKCTSAKLTEKDVILIREGVASGIPQRHFSRLYGVNHTAIYKIVHNKRWRHLK